MSMLSENWFQRKFEYKKKIRWEWNIYPIQVPDDHQWLESLYTGRQKENTLRKWAAIKYSNKYPELCLIV